MEELKIKIDPSDITAMVKDAIMANFTEGKRDELVKAAVESVLKGNWQNPSEMQRAFADGARDALRQIVGEELRKTEREAQLQAVFVEAWTRMFDGEQRAALVEKLADQMRKALTGERY